MAVSVCVRVCVRGSWVNNCVGLANQKFFLLFLLYVWLISMHAIVLVLWRFWSCMGEDTTCPGKHGSVAAVVTMLIFAFLFGLFTFCMMCDQAQAIVTNMTGTAVDCFADLAVPDAFLVRHSASRAVLL
jgi:hypothetical protein